MTDFLIDGKIVSKNEPWAVFIVYGDFEDPATKKNFIIIRQPSGRVPWTKKIVPAINRLVRQWGKCEWYVDGEDIVIEEGNVYIDTGKPIPATGRLWDCTASHYEWDGTKLVKVESIGA